MEFIVTKEHTAIPTLNRMPENKDELETLMNIEGKTDFKEKVLFLQGALRAGRIHNITFDATKYKNIFIEYLNQEKQKEA